jgi:hypothetical protein
MSNYTDFSGNFWDSVICERAPKDTQFSGEKKQECRQLTKISLETIQKENRKNFTKKFNVLPSDLPMDVFPVFVRK